MCFAVNQVNRKAIQDQLELWTKRELDLIGWSPRRWVDAFGHPRLPIMMAGGQVELAEWGLIPSWVRDDAKAVELQKMTLNARIETIFELPSFKASALAQRCLIPVNGFFEYQHREGGKLKVPHRLSVLGEEVMFLGGLYSAARNKLTFTICTKDANTLMKEIHNSKMRMPVIVPDGLKEAWLAKGTRDEMRPFLESQDEGLVAEICQGKPRRGEELEESADRD